MNDNEFRETIEEFRPDVCIDLALEDIKDNSDNVAKEYRGEVKYEPDRQNWR